MTDAQQQIAESRYKSNVQEFKNCEMECKEGTH